VKIKRGRGRLPTDASVAGLEDGPDLVVVASGWTGPDLDGVASLRIKNKCKYILLSQILTVNDDGTRFFA
jgi:hypothetical protein